MENNLFKELTLTNDKGEKEKTTPEIDDILNIQNDDNLQQKSRLRNGQIEKKLVKNTEISKNEENEPSRAETIILKIDGQTIETQKYYFDYPERIKKETGILGYERTKIAKDSLFNFYRQYYKTQYGFDFEKYHINNEADFISYAKNIRPKIQEMSDQLKKLEKEKNSIEEYLEKKDSHLNPLLGGTWGKWEEHYKKRLKEIAEKIRNLECNALCKDLGIENLIELFKCEDIVNDNLMNYKILMSLSEGEYPRYTQNHQMGGYANDNRAARMEENFRDDKFFVQKIYDTNRIKKLTKRDDGTIADGRLIFNFPADENWQIPKSNITLFNKQTGERLSDKQLHVGRLAEYEKQIKSDSVFGATMYGGFNVMPSTFFFGPDLKKVSFGFPMKLESFHEEYLLKSLRAFEKIATKNLSKEKEDKLVEGMIRYRGPIGQIVFMLFLNKAMSDLSLFEEIGGDFTSRDLEDPKTFEKLHKIFKQFIQDFPRIYNVNIDLEKYVVNQVDFNKGYSGLSKLEESFFKNYFLAGSIIADKNKTRVDNILDSGAEEYLPVFINHDEIPQLAWGHAKYAHYSNEKGFNFFKFKHTDHLPTKPSLES